MAISLLRKRNGRGRKRVNGRKIERRWGIKGKRRRREVWEKRKRKAMGRKEEEVGWGEEEAEEG